MLTLELATSQQHYEELLNMVCNQSTSCLQTKYDWIQLTCEQFGKYFRSIGSAYRICQDHLLVGMCWVGETNRILYVYGIIVQPEYQSRGFGRQALELLEYRYQDRIDAIELRVHSSNPRAKSLYERLNFVEIDYETDSGFYLLHKNCGRRILSPLLVT